MFDTSNMGEQIKERLKRCGEGIVIYPLAKIVKPEVVEIGDYSRIEDFVFIYGGKGIRIGRYVNVGAFTSIIGGGELVIGDFAAIACGARFVTGMDVADGGSRINHLVSIEQRTLVLGKIVLEKDVLIGTSVVIHPNVTIGEGAIIGSNSLVIKSIEPWSINVGSPCRKTGERPRVTVPDI
ncbi:acyltransferase [Chloroflexota bacterium]